MKHIITFLICIVVVLQSSCNSIINLQKEEKPELIAVHSILLKITGKTALKMGLLGGNKGCPNTFTSNESEIFIDSLKKQTGSKLISSNSLFFVSGEEGTYREVAERKTKQSIENKKDEDDLQNDTTQTDTGVCLSAGGYYDSNNNTINLTHYKFNVTLLNDNEKDKDSSVGNLNISSPLILEDGHTLLHGAISSNYVKKSTNNSLFLLFVTAKRLAQFKKLKNELIIPQKKMANINIISLKVPQSLVEQSAIKDSVVEKLKNFSPYKPMQEYLSSKETHQLINFLTKQTGVELENVISITTVNKQEGVIRYLHSTENDIEIGMTMLIYPEINHEDNTITFDLSPVRQILNQESKEYTVLANSLQMPIYLKNNHTLLLKNTLSTDDDNILFTFITGKILSISSKQ